MTSRVLFLLCCFAGTLIAENPPERSRLYKKPDPASSGGIKGRIGSPALPIEEVLAVSAEDVEQVYEGEVSGPQRGEFQFKGLPVGKYDLLVLFASEFYEGMRLSREASTLTAEDLTKINTSIQKSEPFFLKKFVHRVEGDTGRGQNARAICTFLRDKDSSLMLEQFEGQYNRADFRRTFKLVLLKDVGPGWQIVRARDLYPVWMKATAALPAHKFSAALQQVRVADQMKDIGTLQLAK